MSIENIIASTAVSFAGGFAFGQWYDNKYGNYSDVFEAIKDTLKNQENANNKKTTGNKLVFNIRGSLAVVNGLAMSFITTQNQDYLLQNSLINGISFYIGSVMGSAVSKTKRRKIKITEQEKEYVKTKLDDLKYRDWSNEFLNLQGNKEVVSLGQYVISKKNPDFTESFVNEFRKTLNYSKIYNLIEREKLHSGELIKSQIVTLANPKDLQFHAFVIYNKGVLEITYELSSKRESEKGYKFKIRKKNTNTVADTTNLIINKSKTAPVLVAKINDHVQPAQIPQLIYESFITKNRIQ